MKDVKLPPPSRYIMESFYKAEIEELNFKLKLTAFGCTIGGVFIGLISLSLIEGALTYLCGGG